jgi:Trypsin-like peptidase domain
MFAKATSMYWRLQCNVGGGSATVKGKLHGLGCLLSDTLIVTARHVWSEHAAKYSWVVVLKHDGLFRCSIVQESEKDDLLFLRAEDCLDATASKQAPAEYPQIYASIPVCGLSVGFLTWVIIAESGGAEEDYAAFSHCSVAMYSKKKKVDDPPLIVLSGGIFQKGSSGGPVYTPDGRLVGVIVQSWQFPTSRNHRFPTIVTAPVVMPLASYANIIAQMKGNKKGARLD